MKIPFAFISLVLLLITGSLFLLSFKTTGADEVYQEYCASCHGADLEGGNAQSLVDGVWQFGDGDGYVRRNIQFGIPPPGHALLRNLSHI